MTGRPGSGRRTSLLPLTTPDSGVMQARPFLPFMFMPSEPQTPSRQERRYEKPSSFSLISANTSRTIRSLPPVSTSNDSILGAESVSGL
ncbi:hypothetical protein D3C78_1486450 [compost metagenome]